MQPCQPDACRDDKAGQSSFGSLKQPKRCMTLTSVHAQRWQELRFAEGSPAYVALSADLKPSRTILPMTEPDSCISWARVRVWACPPLAHRKWGPCRHLASAKENSLQKRARRFSGYLAGSVPKDGLTVVLRPKPHPKLCRQRWQNEQCPCRRDVQLRVRHVGIALQGPVQADLFIACR